MHIYEVQCGILVHLFIVQYVCSGQISVENFHFCHLCLKLSRYSIYKKIINH